MNFFQLSGYLILLLLLEAITDVSNDKYKQTGKKLFGFITHSAQLIIFMAIYGFGKLTADYSIIMLLYTLVGYILYRIALFNVTYNVMARKYVLTIGTSNVYDIYLLTPLKKVTGGYFEMIYCVIMGLSLFFACYMISMVQYL
jgi:hypothetical protein